MTHFSNLRNLRINAGIGASPSGKAAGFFDSTILRILPPQPNSAVKTIVHHDFGLHLRALKEARYTSGDWLSLTKSIA
jgi:hypothetical protein